MDHSELNWRKSSYTNAGTNGNCVEMACLPLAMAVRDSKNPAAGTLTFPTATWIRFLSAAQSS